MKYIDEYRDSALSMQIIQKIKEETKENINIMEVCGTHTMSIFRHGIRSVLPAKINLISGPGCPVCVTPQGEIDAFIKIAKEKDVIVAVFGDLMKIPGSTSCLNDEKREGADVRIVYSVFDAVEIAKNNRDKRVVFFGIGFETTTPTIAASVDMADKMGIDNFFVFISHKLVIPALNTLVTNENIKINGFLLPGHVLLVSGTDCYQDFVNKYKIPAVVGGFEPVDILSAILMLLRQYNKGEARVENGYERAVTKSGNLKAKALVESIFEPCDSIWRGIGLIPKSGLRLKKKYIKFDASKKFDVEVKNIKPPKLCICGEILTGYKTPKDCKLFKKICNPENPVGPCMVSSEGTCSAYFKYL